MRVLSAVVLALASAGVAFGDEREAPDRWAPGALDPAWATIAALQAWPSFGTEPPDWEAASGDPEPLVRAAAAAALGRGRFGQAARWLRPMLEDQSELVRSTALWALLQAPDESAREPLLFALASWERFDDDSAAPFGSPGALFRRAGLPADIVSLGKDERAEWLARFDRASWPPPPAPPTGPGRGPTWAMAAGGWLSAERSEWDADEGVDLELALTAPGRVELSYVGWRALKSLARDPQPRGGPTLRTFDGLVAVTAATPGARERLRLGGDPAILPGIYVLSRVGGGNPLFFRVRRSRAAEQALPALLEAAPHDLATVTRLGELRVKAAAPLLLRLWRQARSGAARRRAERQRAAMCGTVSDPESEVPFAALLGLESASAYAALLADGWPPLLEPEPEVWPAGLLEAGRGAATATLAGWRRLAGQANGAATLAAAASWPGVWRDPSAARAITEMAEAYCGSGLTSRDDVTWVTRNALEALAHFAPDQAAAFLVARLRRPPSAPLLVQQPAGRESPAYTSVLRRSFEALRHDTAVPAETRAALAAAAVTYEQLEDETSIPAEALEAWLQRAVTWSSPPARIDAVVRAARAALARQADPKAQVLLAELERRHGRWDEAIRLAREALPGVPADRRAFTRSVLAFALAAQGDALQAQQELTAAHAAKGWMAGEPDEARAWARNLVTRPLREGLRLRHERVSAAEIRGGSFFAQSAQRLRFAETPGSAGELTAVLPLPPRQIVALAPRRAAVLLDDGSVLAYDARSVAGLARHSPAREAAGRPRPRAPGRGGRRRQRARPGQRAGAVAPGGLTGRVHGRRRTVSRRAAVQARARRAAHRRRRLQRAGRGPVRAVAPRRPHGREPLDAPSGPLAAGLRPRRRAAGLRRQRSRDRSHRRGLGPPALAVATGSAPRWGRGPARHGRRSRCAGPWKSAGVPERHPPGGSRPRQRSRAVALRLATVGPRPRQADPAPRGRGRRHHLPRRGAAGARRDALRAGGRGVAPRCPRELGAAARSHLAGRARRDPRRGARHAQGTGPAARVVGRVLGVRRRAVIWSSRPPLAALALAALMASGATLRASDRWAPGARDPAWEQLGALQAWRAGSPPFDAPALASHRDPLLREVLAAALGRDGARSPELLAALADDPERAVRVAALWGLLQADDVAGRAALLAAVGRSDDQLFAGGDLFWRIGLPRPSASCRGPRGGSGWPTSTPAPGTGGPTASAVPAAESRGCAYTPSRRRASGTPTPASS